MRREKSIELQNLSIGYRQSGSIKVVASDVDASLYSGELTCLLGANGVGKSTLLRTITANQPKLSGSILFNGKELASYSAKNLSSLISIVLTERLEIRNITVFELVGMGRAPYTGFWGSLSKDDRRVVEESLKLVKIEHLTDRMTHTLSDGERQKVMIAKALAQQTPIILLDEPTAFLDFPSKAEIMQLLHRLSRQTNKTIFLSTHDLDLALQIADKIWLMDKDNGIRTGVPEDMSLDGSLSSYFECKGVKFDRQTGLFKIENDSVRQIRMVGHGHRFAMIRKALLRNGIIASSFTDNTKDDNEIEVNQENIVVRLKDGKKVIVESIEELLDIIV